jgi:molybdopterin synthase catalytic subunit
MPADRLAVTTEALDLERLTALVLRRAGSGVGAVASFVGLVRDENAGRRVQYLEYEAYAPLAVRALERIEREIGDEWPGVTVGLHHRTGRLEIGEASVIIATAATHRADAFAACRYAIERVKQIVPIWKHEYFEGGESWIEGATAAPEDPGARQEALKRACA